MSHPTAMHFRMPTLGLVALLAAAPSAAQKKKDPLKEAPPEVVVTLPLAVDPGKATKLTVRGVRVDTVTEVRLSEPKSSGRLLGKARKVPVPNQQSPAQVGDSEIDIEVTLPAEVPGGVVPFTLIGPGGESRPHELIVNDETPRVAEKEPNDGFRDAQPISVPAVVEGSVRQPQDVDVFRVGGKAGEKLAFEVQARRFGSPVDAMLTLYDADGRIVATAEAAAGRDPLLNVTLPRDGAYFLAIIDAHDQGGPIWLYRLLVRRDG